MRIVAGRHRGRRLAAPPGRETRPTSDRTRQALFNILEHGSFVPGGGSPIRGAHVLDVFAGTGAMGLEALSRGAAHVTFIENARAALAALEKNIAACGEQSKVTVLPADATRPPPAAPRTLTPTLSRQGRGSETGRAMKEKALSPGGRGLSAGDTTGKAGDYSAAQVAFLDPPYGSGFVAPSLAALAARGWLADGAICVVETAAHEAFAPPEGFTELDQRRYGAARVILLRHVRS